MPRRTTVVIQDGTYAKLVEESLRRFGSARAVSKVIDEMVDEMSKAKQQEGQRDLLTLLHSKKVAKTSLKDFERDRGKLSTRLEDRGS